MADIIEKVKSRFPDAVIDSHEEFGNETVVIDKKQILEVMRWLRDDESMAFNFMMDLTAVDKLYFIKRYARYEVVYHLYSLEKNHRLRIKVPVKKGDETINSISSVWVAADWFEREVWDMYGIKFLGHPNLKRILLYEEFEGHPLRKDYAIKNRQPLVGPEN